MGKSSLMLLLLLLLLVAVIHCEAVDVEDADGMIGDKEGGKSESWAGWAKEKLSEGLGFGDKAEEGKGEEAEKDRVVEAAEETGEWVKEKAREGYESAKHKAEAAKRGAQETAQESAGWAKEQAKQGFEHKGEQAAKETVSSPDDEL